MNIKICIRNVVMKSVNDIVKYKLMLVCQNRWLTT